MARINSRTKGKTAERELINALKELLPASMTAELSRNLEQTRSGGHDVIGLEGWAPEVKRYASVKPADLVRFWIQATEQAINAKAKPVLFYREDRRDWRVLLRASDVLPNRTPSDTYEDTLETGLVFFVRLIGGDHV